ncbi:hypothetical protein OSB04_024535 [Centaurea solstitialis]|uniref:Uncharacterized protein n=1 Tax=Centaurea solstitialis TaxID=347529 RepID=A0AA38SLY2_9ASTR|nr:hypothetical protein OSB04_024535 [Centaurea solstitialis]
MDRLGVEVAGIPRLLPVCKVVDVSYCVTHSAQVSIQSLMIIDGVVASTAFKPYISRREEQCLVQFLMALRYDFEGLRGTILHRTPLSTVDSVVHELIVEETRLKFYGDKGPKLPYTRVVFVVPQRS